MALLKASVPNGFTLIEIIFVMALWSSLLGLGLVISFDGYRGHLFSNQTQLVLNYLHYARALSMANVNGSGYGVQLTSFKIILFAGNQYNQNQSSAIVMEDLVTIGSTGEPQVVAFLPLTGQSVSPVIFNLSLGQRQKEVRVNSQGGILW